jgi:hypothetical protein
MGKWLTLVLVLAAGAAWGDSGQEGRVIEARQAARAFLGELKGELTAVLEGEGPIAALQVCREKAPDIAVRRSRETGGRVGRTSLRTRNPANAPDPWEKGVLEEFERRAAAGEDPAGLERVEVVEEAGGKTFRYMKAIPTGELCTICHGTDVAPAVLAKIREAYPADRATGFRPGEIRGAFTFSRPLE